MGQNDSTDDEFYTVSRNPNDVRSILEEEYNTVFTVNEEFGTQEIFDIISSSISKKPFYKYLIGLLQSTGRISQISEDYNCYSKSCINAFIESHIMGMPDIFSDNEQIITRELIRKNANNWFKGIAPSRKSIFLIAVAFRLDCAELSELLTVASGDKDVNFKDPAEVIIYWTLNNHEDYRYALELKRKAERSAENHASRNSELSAVHMNNILTQKYKEQYISIRNEDQLLEYLSELYPIKNQQGNSTSSQLCYNELLSKIGRASSIDKELMAKTESDINISDHIRINFGAIERYLYYFIPIKNSNGHYTTDPFAHYENGNISGSKMNLLGNVKWFFSTLLRRQDIKKMYEGKKPITRDTILTLAFFTVCDSDPFGNTYEHISDINDYLSYCRFEQINFSYPYDFFIFMCMQTSDPLMVFRRVWKMTWKNN